MGRPRVHGDVDRDLRLVADADLGLRLGRARARLCRRPRARTPSEPGTDCDGEPDDRSEHADRAQREPAFPRSVVHARPLSMSPSLTLSEACSSVESRITRPGDRPAPSPRQKNTELANPKARQLRWGESRVGSKRMQAPVRRIAANCALSLPELPDDGGDRVHADRLRPKEPPAPSVCSPLLWPRLP